MDSTSNGTARSQNGQTLERTKPAAFYPSAAVAGVCGAVIGLLAFLVWQAIQRFSASAQLWLPYPFPRQGSEGLILYQTLLMRAGQDVYGPITPTSFISAPYPPVYYWLAGKVTPAGLAEFTDGRGISLWAAVASAVAIGVVVLALVSRRDTSGRFTTAQLLCGVVGGLLAGGLWLAEPAVVIWSSKFRADMLAAAFMVAGVAFVALGAYVAPVSRNGKDLSGWPVWLAVPAFVLAVYTKQTALAGPIAAALFLLLRDFKSGLRWSLITLVIGLAPFVVLDFATQHWFYLKMVDYHNLPFDSRTLLRLLDGFWQDQAPLIVLCAGYLLWRLWRRDLNLAVLFLLANVLLLPTGGVVGADSNHFLFIGLALAICAGSALGELGVGLAGLFGAAKKVPWRAGLGLLVSGSLLVWFLALAATPSDLFSPERMPSAQEQTQLKAIIDMLRNTHGDPFFVDEPGLAALAGKHVAYDDLFTVTALAKTGRWDQSALVAQLAQRKFPLVLLNGDAFAGAGQARQLRSDILSSEMVAGLCVGYHTLYRDVFFTYAPRQDGQGQWMDGQCVN